MSKQLRLFALLLLATAGLASSARADSSAQCMVYTPGYFVDQASWENATADSYRYYKDYEQELQSGYQPSISPYVPNGTAVLDWTGYNALTLTVTNNTTTSQGRYVESWNGYVWDATSHKPYSTTPKFSYTGQPKSFTVTYSMLKGSTRVAIVPQLNMITYSLGYDVNGGSWQTPIATTNLVWTNAVTVAASNVVYRPGYTYTGWNTAAKGDGLAFEPEQVLTNTSGGAQFKVTDNGAKVILYAQWKSNDYILELRPGEGIEKIFYKAQSSEEATSSSLEWRETSVDLDVPVAYESTWSAYAVAKPGYTYSDSSAKKPHTGVMGLGGADFDPVAQANEIRVSYDGNGATAGAMTATDFLYGQEDRLADLGYTRTYTVTFDPNGGSVQPTSETAKYAFVRWNSAADGSGAWSYENKAPVTNPCGSTGENVTLYAQWSPGSVVLPTPTRDGFSFAGWYVDRAGSFKVGDAGGTFTPTADARLYAKWQARVCTVEFRDGYDGQGPDAPLVKSVTVDCGGSATAPTPPAHDGLLFAGWSSSDFQSVKGDLTVYALYRQNDYHVYYNSNYRDGRDERAVQSAGCGPYSDSDVLTLRDAVLSDLKFANDGYDFLGWSWSGDVTNAEWRAGMTMAWNVIAEHLAAGKDGNRANLYAVWQPASYAIHYEAGGGAGEMPDQRLVYGREARLLKNAFAKDGQAFAGWISSEDAKIFSDEQVVSNLTQTAGAVITLTAVWGGDALQNKVRFDSNGWTADDPYVQTFDVTEQRLWSNRFQRVGYEFKGWTTNANHAATAADVVYADRDRYAFPTGATGLTRTLFAVLEPIRYTVIFNTGTNGVTGTMQPLTNCVYDAPVTNTCGYTNPGSPEIYGWTRTVGGPVEILDKDKMVATNLTAEADGCVTLYAVWKSAGELSEAVGLTNATLEATSSKYKSIDEPDVKAEHYSWRRAAETEATWDTGHPVRVACTTDTKQTEGATWTLAMKVLGSGTLRFKWFYLHVGAINEYAVYDTINNVATNKLIDLKATASQKDNWDDPVELRISGEGSHEISWRITGTLTPDDIIAIDDVTWTPDGSGVVTDWPTYTLTYADTRGASPSASLPGLYAVTNETFAFARLDDVEGYAFDGWSPSNVVKGTTGDLTVRAKWRRIVDEHQVRFKLGDGTRTGGGDLEQMVESGYDAVAPKVAPSGGWNFIGWDKAFTNVTCDLVVTALYGRISYRIDYENTLDVLNTNRLGFTVDDLPVALGPLGDTHERAFVGWTPTSVIDVGQNVTVTAAWRDHIWYDVTYELGDNLSRNGGGAIKQSVDRTSDLVEPSVLPGEGYAFVGWDRPVTNGTDVTISAIVARSRFNLTLAGETASYEYGETLALNAPLDAVTTNGTNVVCTGWTGTGCVPSSGSSTQITFSVTGPATLRWVYVTNCWVGVCAGSGAETPEESAARALAANERGAVVLLDPAGGILATNAVWASLGSGMTACARPNAGYVFGGWYFVGANAADSNAMFLSDEPTFTWAVAEPGMLVAHFTVSPERMRTVTFALDENLERTGGGELEQLVEDGCYAVAPTVEASEGHLFAGWYDESGTTVDVMSSPILADAIFFGVATARVCSVDFVLCDHVERTGGGALEQRVSYGGAASVPTAEGVDGYMFTGWFDAAGNPVTAGFVPVTGDATYFARAVKTQAYVGVSVATGCEKMGTVSGGNKYVKVGATVTLRATAKSGYVFGGWYPAGSDFASEPLSQATSYTVTVKDEVAYEALFLAKVFDWAEVDCGAVEPEYEKGVAIEPIAVTARGGSRPTVSVSGLPTGLKFTAKDIVNSRTREILAAANTIYGTPTKSGVYAATVKVTTTGRATASTNLTFVVIDRDAGERVVSVRVADGDGVSAPNRGRTSGQGVYRTSRKVTLRATATKGYVFSGWYDAAESLVSRLASLALIVPADDVAFAARFITAGEDAESIMADVNGMPLFEPRGGEVPLSRGVSTNVSVGVYLEWPVAFDARSATTVAVSGLPTGLKFTAKPITARVTETVGGKRVTTIVTNVPANTIYGRPTVASKTDRWGEVVPSTVKVTVTTAGKNKAVGTIAVTVDALPAWLVATYSGGSVGGDDGADAGSATVTVAKTGKVSGKWVSEGVTRTLAAAGLDCIDAETGAAVATVTAKGGGYAETWTLLLAATNVAEGVTHDGATVGTVEAAFPVDLFTARGANWKAEPWKSLAAAMRNKTFSVASDDGVTLTGKVGASGAVTVAGSFDIGAKRPYSVSVKGTLEPLGGDSFELFVCYPPKGAFAGYVARMVLLWDGLAFTVE